MEAPCDRCAWLQRSRRLEPTVSLAEAVAELYRVVLQRSRRPEPTVRRAPGPRATMPRACFNGAVGWRRR